MARASAADEALNFEYLRNVILQFLERPDMRVSGTGACWVVECLGSRILVLEADELIYPLPRSRVTASFDQCVGSDFTFHSC